MFYTSYSYFGMHAVWWAFWLLSILLLVRYSVPVSRSKWRHYQTSAPLTVLQRSYAAGELTTEEYEVRAAILLRDRHHLAASGEKNPPRPPAARL